MFGTRISKGGMNTARAKALRARINYVAAELETCTTKAQIRCVTQSIQAAEKQLTELVD